MHSHAWPPPGLVDPRPAPAVVAVVDEIIRELLGPRARAAADRPWRRVRIPAGGGGMASCPACGRTVLLDQWRMSAGLPPRTFWVAVCGCGAVVWDPGGEG